MIGGTDIVIGGPTDPGERDLILRLLREAWPNAVVEDCERETTAALAALTFPSRSMSEFLVYRDQESFEAWCRDGATPEHADAMIHVLFFPAGITCVVDGVGSEGKRIVEDLRNAISSSRLRFNQNYLRRGWAA